MTRIKSMTFRMAAAVGLATWLSSAALAQDKVTFTTNWKAQAAHGGFYQGRRMERTASTGST
jgi:ABC-type nitrate/sulfonate/bicarbonate transport system substrate-binding protein